MTAAQAQNETDEDTKPSDFSFDTVIVFGIGPVKPVLLLEEVTIAQKAAWDMFRIDPLNAKEPEFWLMEQPRKLQQLLKIEQDQTLSKKQQEIEQERIRQVWQQNGWFALKRMGKQNALAAGYALYKGFTKEIVLTGGKTISEPTKSILPKERIENWPSEAKLMQDVIVSHYGELYFKKYHKQITNAITIEDAARNTLENFVFTINQKPELLLKETKIGYLSAGYHLERISILAKIFSLTNKANVKLCAQDLLEQAETSDMQTTEVHTIVEEEKCSEMKLQVIKERLWIQALQDPEYLTYWIGFLSDIEHPYVIQSAFNRLLESKWEEAVKKVFATVDLNLHELTGEKVLTLAKNEPQQYEQVRKNFVFLKTQFTEDFPSTINILLAFGPF